MGALGRRERKSELKARTARENARRPRPGARRARDAGEEDTLRSTLTRLRELTPLAVAALEKALTSRDPAVVVRSAGDILDRAGIARQTQTKVALDFPQKVFSLVLEPDMEQEVEVAPGPELLALSAHEIHHDEQEHVEMPEPEKPVGVAYGPLPSVPPAPKPGPVVIEPQACPRCHDREPLGQQFGERLIWTCTEC